jgi:hypothetical protein
MRAKTNSNALIVAVVPPFHHREVNKEMFFIAIPAFTRIPT